MGGTGLFFEPAGLPDGLANPSRFRVECQQCPLHMLPNDAQDGCVCNAGYYDAWQGSAPAWDPSGRFT